MPSLLELVKSVDDALDTCKQQILESDATIEQLNRKLDDLQANYDMLAASAAAIAYDAGKFNSNAQSNAARLIADCADNPIITAVRAAVFAWLGDEDQKAAWLRSKGWINDGGGSFGWSQGPLGGKYPLENAVNLELQHALKSSAWMLDKPIVASEPGDTR